MIDKVEDKLKKVHLVLVIIGIIVFQYVFPAAEHSARDNSLDKIVINHESRITNLENGYLGNRELLIEIKFNLKQHIREQGGEYIEGVEPSILMQGNK
jgi:hypothetical protein